ncbi:MAG: FecR domain-containing protein [Lautropia sp.]|nr:FecR domain-containing protein [Lautropia sp.]
MKPPLQTPNVWPDRPSLLRRPRRPQLLGSLLCAGALLLAGQQTLAHSHNTPAGTPGAHADDILYTVKPNDTLIGISRDQLDKTSRWQDVQQYNGIDKPRHLPPGSILRLRPEWLKPSAVMAMLSSASNQVQADGKPVSAGAQLGEGSIIRTGADSTATIKLPDGTQLRIPSATQVRIKRLRAYHGEKDLDALFQLDKGGIEPDSPGQRKRPLKIRTPSGNAAVRGTRFRVQAQDKRSTIEVLRGQVEGRNQAGSALVDAGQGAYFTPGKAPKVEPLLPAPSLASLDGERFTQPNPTVNLPPLGKAAAYRVEVSADEQFNQLLLDARTNKPQFSFKTQADGVYHVRVRPVSAQSIEGHDSIARLEVRARPLPPILRPLTSPVPTGQTTLTWQDTTTPPPPNADARRYRVQIAQDARFAQVLHDEIHLVQHARLYLHARGPLDRWWRVATIEGRHQGPFSEPGRFVMRPPAPVQAALPRRVVKSGGHEPIRTGSGDLLMLSN